MKLYSYSLKKTVVREFDSLTTSTPDAVAMVARSVIDFDRDQEQVVAVYLNNHNEVIGTYVVSIGTLDASMVHPRDVFKSAVLSSAAAFVLVHNHPSESLKPSFADISVTKRFVDAGNMMGIPMFDHIIVTENNFLSMKAEGLMKA